MSRYHLAACLAPYTWSTPPDLHSSPPPRPRACSMPPELPISIPLHIHIPTPAAHSQSPRAPYLPPIRPYACTTPPEFQISIPLRFHVPIPALVGRCKESDSFCGGELRVCELSYIDTSAAACARRASLVELRVGGVGTWEA